MTTTAFLGLGTMGRAMATSALRAGIPTIVWNREPEATRNVAELGAEVAETAADAARRAEIVVTMVTDADAVISIARDQGMLAALAPGTIWAGAVGAGSRLKLVNNTWLAFTSEAVSSSIALARRLGLGTETVVGALDGGPLVSPWQSAKLLRIAKDDYSTQFGLSLALKDVHLALQAADDGRFAALASLADEWQQAVDDGLGDQDLTVMTRALEQDRGTGGTGL